MFAQWQTEMNKAFCFQVAIAMYMQVLESYLQAVPEYEPHNSLVIMLFNYALFLLPQVATHICTTANFHFFNY